jgi:hypothetical protein
LIAQTVSDAQAIVASSNITSADLATLAADHKAIQADLGSSNPKGSMGGPAGSSDDFLSLGGLLGGGTVGMRGPMGIGGRFGVSWAGGPSGNGQVSSTTGSTAHEPMPGPFGGGPFRRWKA